MSGIPPLLFTSSPLGPFQVPVVTPPATIQASIIAYVEAIAPGYTSNLPGSLIDDVLGTDTGAVATIDQARVDAINNVSPYAANAFVLAQQGFMLGLPQGLPTNGSVYVVFTGTPGYVIPVGFLVGDGTNQYAIVDGGVIASGGTSSSLYAIATNSSIFAIPAASVTTIVTSVASGYTLTVTNPLQGIPATTGETVAAYRSRIAQATNVAISGAAAYIRSLVEAVPGVNPILVSVLQYSTYWEVIVGGGDEYQVAAAIYQGVSCVGLLTGAHTLGSTTTVSLIDGPNTYSVPYVQPATQTTTVAVTWNTNLANFAAAATVNQYIIGAVIAYGNSIPVGQPFNLLVMFEYIQDAIAPVLPLANLTTLFVGTSATSQYITINSTNTSPNAGTFIIPGDAESYFYIAPSGVTSVQS